MAVTINFYNKAIEYGLDNTIDYDGDTFKMALMNASHAFLATNTVWANVSANDLGSGNGYTAAGQALTSVTLTESAGVVTFDAADVTWTATGGDIGPATDAVIYSDTAAADQLVCSIDFDGAQTAGNGTDFLVSLNASGIFTVS